MRRETAREALLREITRQTPLVRPLRWPRIVVWLAGALIQGTVTILTWEWLKGWR